MTQKIKKSFFSSSFIFQLILPVISALLLILAYPNFNLAFLAWVALVPLFFGLENNNAAQRFISGYLFGAVFFSGILYWLFGVTITGAAALVAALSFMPAIFCFLYLPAKRHPIYSIIYVPSAWVLSEYLRTHLFTGFPWAFLGYSQSSSIHLIQFADITGVYGVSFLIVLVNVGLYLALRKAPHRFYILSFIFVLIGASLTYGEIMIRRDYPLQTLKASVIQGNIPLKILWDPKCKTFAMDTYKRITDNAIAEDRPDLVIWPEGALPGYLEEKDLRKAMTDYAKSEKIYLLTGIFHREGSETFNSACLISDKGDILERYDKIYLVPFGEFVPFKDKFPWLRLCVKTPMGLLTKGGDYVVFKFKPQEAEGSYSFSCLVCYEDIFPDPSRRSVRKGARFLASIANDAWFGKTSAPYQHLQGSIFRAIENRVPVLRAANTGVSCMIDFKGRVTRVVRKGKDELYVDGYITGNVSMPSVRTFYTRFGDLFSWVCIIFALFGFFLIRRT